MAATELSPDLFYGRHRGGRAAPGDEFGARLAGYQGAAAAAGPAWADPEPVCNHIAEVERIWAAIAEGDDWTPLADHIAAIRRLGAALGPAPLPSGHLSGV